LKIACDVMEGGGIMPTWAITMDLW